MSDAIATAFENNSALLKQLSPQTNASAGSKAGNYGWILHPVLDMLFCCGGFVWIFFLLHYLGFGPDNISKPVQIMLSSAALGAIGLSETHVMATLQRVYKGDNRQKFGAQTKIAAIACGLLALTGCFFPVLVPIYLKIYLLFVAQHFTAQTFGLTLLYCAKRGYLLENHEKLVLSILLQSTMWVAVLRQLTWKEWSGTELLDFKLPFWGALPEWICHCAELTVLSSALFFLFVIACKWRTEKTILPLPAALMIITGVFVFLAGKSITETLWLYVPAFFHGSQYIAVSLALYLKEKGLPEGLAAHQIGTLVTEADALRYLGLLLICALAFFQLIPFIVGLLGLNSATFAAATFAAIHFHHFITDRAIWKLRNPEIRKLLVA